MTSFYYKKPGNAKSSEALADALAASSSDVPKPRYAGNR